MGDCQYPDCKAAATETWALVPLCEHHREAVRAETAQYYNRRITYHMRHFYMGIMPLIPWSRKE